MVRDTALKVLCRQLVVVGMLAIICAWVGNRYLSFRLEQATGFNLTLHHAIDELMPQAQQTLQLQQRYAYLLQRQRLIESLDARRSTSVLLLADVADALPREVYLTRFEENGERVVIEGRAVDSDGVARFMEQLAKSAYLVDVTLSEIRSQDPDITIPFQFSMAGRVLLANQIATGFSSGKDAQ